MGKQAVGEFSALNMGRDRFEPNRSGASIVLSEENTKFARDREKAKIPPRSKFPSNGFVGVYPSPRKPNSPLLRKYGKSVSP